MQECKAADLLHSIPFDVCMKVGLPLCVLRKVTYFHFGHLIVVSFKDKLWFGISSLNNKPSIFSLEIRTKPAAYINTHFDFVLSISIQLKFFFSSYSLQEREKGEAGEGMTAII